MADRLVVGPGRSVAIRPLDDAGLALCRLAIAQPCHATIMALLHWMLPDATREDLLSLDVPTIAGLTATAARHLTPDARNPFPSHLA